MSLTKIFKSFQITLPASLREDLDVKGGDYLEVTVENGVFIFKPVKIVEVPPPKGHENLARTVES